MNIANIKLPTDRKMAGSNRNGRRLKYIFLKKICIIEYSCLR